METAEHKIHARSAEMVCGRDRSGSPLCEAARQAEVSAKC